jgi:Tfp pilus assembly protein PilO
MLGVTLAAVVVVALGWLFAISPTLAQADLASVQADNTKAQNAAQQIALVKLKGQHDKLPQLQADLAKLQVAIPDAVDLDDFLDQLQQLAQATGVTITTFTAAEATPYGGNEAAATGSASSSSSSSGSSSSDSSTAPADASKTDAASTAQEGVKTRLYSVPISIVLTGTPEQVMAFTDASQKGDRFFLVTSDTFTGSRDHPEDDGGTLTGFVFVVRDAPPSVTAAK